MRVLVTGAAGFLGQATCAELAARGNQVMTAVRRGNGDTALDLATGDIRGALHRLRPEVVIHCAGATAGSDLAALMVANHRVAARLLSAAEDASVARVVLVGSAAAYAPMRDGPRAIAEDHPLAPVSAYGQSKAALHRLGAAAVTRGRVAVVTAVPFNIFGPGQPARQAPQAFIGQLRSRPAEMRIGNLAAERDWVDVRDVARALVLLAVPGVPPGAYNIASGRARATGALLDRLCALTRISPALVADSAMRARPTLARSRGDASKIAATCGWHPRVTLDQSLRDMLAAG